MDLSEFENWSPNPPNVDARTSHSVTLSWSAGPYSFLEGDLVYTIQRKEKIPPWVTAYSGGKTVRTIDNLAPTHPHKFRLKITLKPEKTLSNPIEMKALTNTETRVSSMGPRDNQEDKISRVLHSQWSEETWTSTDSDGTTAACFCMAVRCGYIKQVQQMFEERPVLLSAINANTGLTPLATAVRKGDITMVRLLLSLGADVEQRSIGERTPLHLAVLAAHCKLAELLLEYNADINAKDISGLRVEHHAVDSGDLETLKLILDRGDLTVTDSNGWTPLFRAVCQGSKTELIQELVSRGSRVEVTDRAGLTLLSAARLLKDRHGRRRDSVLKLVDNQFQHEKVVANFTRLTKKISRVQAILSNK